jgi:hypothetical protein
VPGPSSRPSLRICRRLTPRLRGVEYGLVAGDGDLAARTDAIVHAVTAEPGRLVPLLAPADPNFAIVTV